MSGLHSAIWLGNDDHPVILVMINWHDLTEPVIKRLGVPDGDELWVVFALSSFSVYQDGPSRFVVLLSLPLGGRA